jgi:hypothetical protein
VLDLSWRGDLSVELPCPCRVATGLVGPLVNGFLIIQIRFFVSQDVFAHKKIKNKTIIGRTFHPMPLEVLIFFRSCIRQVSIFK